MTGLQGASLSVGIALGFVVAPSVFAKSGDWHIALAFMAVPTVIALIFNIIFALGPKPPYLATQDCAVSDSPECSLAFKKIIKLPVFWAGVFSAFLLSWAMQGYNDITPGHLAIAS